MNKRIVFIIVSLLLADFCRIYSMPDSLKSPVFGTMRIYLPGEQPGAVILFVSGDRGWNNSAAAMAEMFSRELNALVVGIDIRNLFKVMDNSRAKCLYPASDFELLSKFIQHYYKLPGYINPVLVGFGSGGTLVYGILAQAPANTFKGAVGLGFSTSLHVNKIFCSGSGLHSEVIKPGVSVLFKPSGNLGNPFYVLQTPGEDSNSRQVGEFIRQTGNAKLITLSQASPDFSKSGEWMLKMKDAFDEIQHIFAEKLAKVKPVERPALIPKPPVLDDLPLHITPSANDTSMPIAFMISGDGGWTDFDQQLANELAARKIPSVGLDALHYFWEEKPPGKVVKDIAPVIKYYLEVWQRKSFIFMGYSFGADVSPFIIESFDKTIISGLKVIVLLSPSEKTDFEIHISDMLSFEDEEEKNDVVAALRRIPGIPTLCVFGKEEDTRLPVLVREKYIDYLRVNGGHHFSDLPLLMNTIVRFSR